MRPIRRIAIYLGRGEQLTRRYLLCFLCDRWRAAGIELTLLDDPGRSVEAELAILHVDATRRAPAYDAVLGRYPRVINAAVRDISKRRISTQLLLRGSAYDQPVIVKTDSNYFGLSDFSGGGRTEGATRQLCRRLVDRLLPTPRIIRQSGTYPIYPSLRQVPWRDWWDRRLVVEKFLPETRDGLYCLRTWVFFGGREKVSISFSSNPVVKRRNAVRREFIGEVPDSIREARRLFGFDYGKFDFVIHQGRPVLLDTNSTPGCGGQPTPRLTALADELAADVLAPSALVPDQAGT